MPRKAFEGVLKHVIICTLTDDIHRKAFVSSTHFAFDTVSEKSLENLRQRWSNPAKFERHHPVLNAFRRLKESKTESALMRTWVRQCKQKKMMPTLTIRHKGKVKDSAVLMVMKAKLIVELDALGYNVLNIG